jgi:hypothetical protein
MKSKKLELSFFSLYNANILIDENNKNLTVDFTGTGSTGIQTLHICRPSIG